MPQTALRTRVSGSAFTPTPSSPRSSSRWTNHRTISGSSLKRTSTAYVPGTNAIQHNNALGGYHSDANRRSKHPAAARSVRTKQPICRTVGGGTFLMIFLTLTYPACVFCFCLLLACCAATKYWHVLYVLLLVASARLQPLPW